METSVHSLTTVKAEFVKRTISLCAMETNATMPEVATQPQESAQLACRRPMEQLVTTKTPALERTLAFLDSVWDLTKLFASP
jgi:hypothetical protein